MTINDLIKLRLSNQQLTQKAFKTPAELVSHFGAMQAQDYAMSKWAVGIRTGLNEKTIEDAINSDEIVRTHILRPTWHLVAAADVRWMLPVSAARIKASCASAYRMLELDTKTLTRCNAILEKALSGHNHLTRDELMLALNKKKIATNDLRSVHIMMNAEQDRIVCNGPMRGKQFTYALMDEKVPAARPLKREEALVLLAKRYFTSHGPATLPDFSWWAGIPLTQCKAAMEGIGPEFLSEQIGDKTYWFNSKAAAGTSTNGTWLLPAFDEYLLSYKDRTASLDISATRQTITVNGIFKPIVVVDGKVTGIWKRTVKRDTVNIDVTYFEDPKKPKVDIGKAAKYYADFLEKKMSPLP